MTLERITLISAAALVALSCNSQKWTETTLPEYTQVTQEGGSTLGYSPQSGVKIITDKGFAFKDLDRDGELDPYEDWRLSAEERAKDLASKMSIEQIAGLMLYSGHQSVPGTAYGFGAATYGGKTLEESGANHYDLTDQQKKFLSEDNLRAVLVTYLESPEIAAKWNNNVQRFVEGLGLGIPANNSSDPRNETTATAEFNMGSGGEISLWPTTLGLAATFYPSTVEKFGQIASKEYRALGIATALSPQIDLATEPRWSRFGGTFGEGTRLATDMARAYVDGFQTTEGESSGWGKESVNAMVKHWPGGGPEEGGRDAHFNYGKFAVYPGGNFAEHLKTFVEGAFKLSGPTKKASAVMPYYTISYNVDPSGKNVGNSYNSYIITDLLRDKYGYDGVVCTDWNITYDNASIESFDGKCWGVENLTVAQRHYEVLKAGVDQFGGNNDKGPVLEAYKMWVSEFGDKSARERFERSAVRLLLNSFRTGLFENPYLDPEQSSKIVGNAEFMKEGYDAQLRSIVMLKNEGKALPAAQKAKVYVPKRHFPAERGMFGFGGAPAKDDYPISKALVEKYFTWCEDPSEADFALILITEPKGNPGYEVSDREKGGNGYTPISLQYSDYTAVFARDSSIAGGDPKENFLNRTYKGKTVKTDNATDLALVSSTRKAMGDKPVVVVVSATRPFIPEFEKDASAVLLTFGVQDQAVLDIVSGKTEPSALLPMQMPLDMKTVELQKEDVPRDMTPYVDSQGNKWDFAFGLNWSGVINDDRVKKYK